MAKLRPLPAFRIATILGGWLLFAQALSIHPSLGQDEEKTAAKSANRIESHLDLPLDDPLKILWLRNPTTGELVPVPGLTIDEYDNLDRIRRGLPPEITAPPNFILSELKLNGSAKGSAITCELNLAVELRNDRWARIPLGMTRAVIRSAPSEEDWLVTPDIVSDGFILWAKGAAGDKKTVKIQFDFPLDRSADTSRLQLLLPRARSASANITIEANDATLRIEGAGAVDSSKFAGGLGEIHCSGFASNLDLTWKPKSQTVAFASWLEAAGTVEVRVDGRRQIRADAKLRIRTFGDLNQPLRIKIPKGMRLSPDAAMISPYVRSQSTTNEIANVAASRQVLELNIDPVAPSDFELRLQAESAGPIPSDAAGLSLEGFEVEGAKRHWGYLDLLLTSDWYVSAGQAPAIRRSDVEAGVPTDSTFARTRFEYASQGAAIQLSARLPRTFVEPSYDLTIESSQLRMQCAFKYRFRGPSAPGIEIDLGDWDLERIYSLDATFLVDDVQQNGSKLFVPVASQQLAVGAESTIRLEVRRNNSEAIVRLHLPQPSASVEAPAIVRVSSDVNLEVAPRSTEFKGVSVDSTASSPGASHQRSQFVYRTRSGIERPQLAFDVHVRKQSLMQDLTTHLSMTGPRSISLKHEMQLNVAYEPMREVVLDIPFAIGSFEPVQVMLDDQPLERIDAVENEVADENGYIWTRCRYLLPQAYLGPLKISIQYPFSAPKSPDESALLRLPLPKLITMSQLVPRPHQLIVLDSTRSIQIDASVWSLELIDELGPFGEGESRYSSATPQVQIAFQLLEAQARAEQSNHIDRWWLQTTLGENTRTDRLCIRASFVSAPLRVRLPASLDIASLIVAVDGAKEEMEQYVGNDRILTLKLPLTSKNKSRVIELWYRCDSSTIGWGTKLLEAPSLTGDKIFGRSYWQVLTPADWYSLCRPAGWTHEHAIDFRDGWWRVGASLDQVDLEKWVGASQQPKPPFELNQYLFSTMTPRYSISLTLAPRRELWLSGLGCVFVISSMLIYFVSLRRPLVFLALASTTLIVMIFQPHWSLAVTQFLIVGLSVSLFAWIMKAILAPRQMAQPRSASSRSGARAVDTSLLPAESGSSPRRGSSISGVPAQAGPTP